MCYLNNPTDCQIYYKSKCKQINKEEASKPPPARCSDNMPYILPTGFSSHVLSKKKKTEKHSPQHICWYFQLVNFCLLYTAEFRDRK